MPRSLFTKDPPHSNIPPVVVGMVIKNNISGQHGRHFLPDLFAWNEAFVNIRGRVMLTKDASPVNSL